MAHGRPAALPGRVSRASWQTKCPSICSQTLKWSDKPGVGTQAGEKSSQSGVEARHMAWSSPTGKPRGLRFGLLMQPYPGYIAKSILRW